MIEAEQDAKMEIDQRCAFFLPCCIFNLPLSVFLTLFFLFSFLLLKVTLQLIFHRGLHIPITSDHHLLFVGSIVEDQSCAEELVQ